MGVLSHLETSNLPLPKRQSDGLDCSVLMLRPMCQTDVLCPLSCAMLCSKMCSLWSLCWTKDPLVPDWAHRILSQSRWVVVVFFFFFKGMGGCRNSDLLLLCHLSWLPNGPGQLQSLPQQLLQVPLFHSTFSTWIPGQATNLLLLCTQAILLIFWKRRRSRPPYHCECQHSSWTMRGSDINEEVTSIHTFPIKRTVSILTFWSLFVETASCCAAWTVAQALSLVLPSSLCLVSCPMSRGCQSKRSLNRVSVSVHHLQVVC